MATTYPLATIAKLLDLTPRRVQQLSTEGVIPRAERGRYELVTAVQGYIKYLRDRAINSEGTNGGAEGYLVDRSRLMRVNADMAELELKVRQGELMPVADVATGLERTFTVFRARTLAVPSKLAPILVGMHSANEVEDELTREVEELLDELHRFAAGIQGGDGDGQSGAEATAEADGEPVG